MNEVIRMKRLTMIAIGVLLVWGLPAMAEGGLSLGFWADEHAPYLCVMGAHSFGLGFGVGWELGLWWYRCEVPLTPFTSAAITPMWSAKLAGGWSVEVAVSLRLETSSPSDRWACGEFGVSIMPCVLLFHPW